MDVKCYRSYSYGSANIDVDAHTTLTRGVAILNAIRDPRETIYGGPGTCIRLNAAFANSPDAKCESVLILGGRQSILQWLRLQGETPEIFNNAGSGPLFLQFFRKHRTFGKDSTLVRICPWKIPLSLGTWEAHEPIDLRYCLGSNPRRPEVSPTRLATILELTFNGVAA